MPRYSLGDVVNIRFPNQEDPKKSTYHPGIVVEDLEDEVLLIFMTHILTQQRNYPDSFIIDDQTLEGKSMGLTYKSLICPSRKYQVKKIRIYPPPRGKCTQEIIERLEELL